MNITLTPESLIIYAIVGLAAGWIASKVINSHGMGILGLLLTGVVGAILGAWIFNKLGINIEIHPWVDRILIATVGAILVLWVYNLVSNRKK